MTQDQWAKDAEDRLLDEALKLSPQLGWSERMVRAAGKACGFSAGETELLAPHGPADLAALLSRRHDAQALTALRGLNPSPLKIRERIAKAIEARIDASAGDEAAVRRWTGYLALPAHAPLGLRLAWESADQLWRWAGDTATDENHYSKRALLAGILTGALAVRLASGRAAALAFADRRIADVMRYEKWKATSRFRPGDLLAAAAGALGRMRYGRTEAPASPDLRDAP